MRVGLPRLQCAWSTGSGSTRGELREGSALFRGRGAEGGEATRRPCGHGRTSGAGPPAGNRRQRPRHYGPRRRAGSSYLATISLQLSATDHRRWPHAASNSLFSIRRSPLAEALTERYSPELRPPDLMSLSSRRAVCQRQTLGGQRFGCQQCGQPPLRPPNRAIRVTVTVSFAKTGP